ncbi:hybrid sensor histidine kinase/response regulator [Algoriphagus algorifonticola]|uniref:hybrid sensor histidine kinase/response regulator n=1 Tax=Algoriphagus algorifonticola TaxID=2593007 RepID=UPI0011A52424|nr:hybrid sensor histidine kinase/response regulator [Algoriphagus algorifonticola]
MKNKIVKIIILGLILFLPRLTSAQVKVSQITEYPFSVYRDSKLFDAEDSIYTIQNILSSEEILPFNDIPNRNSNLGFTTSNYWVKFKLVNDSEEDKVFFLETGRPITDSVVLYKIQEGQINEKLNNGDLVAWQDRAFDHRKIIFPIKLEAGKNADFFINYQSDGEVINLPLEINSPSSLISSSYFDQLIYGIFYGILLLTGITYLFFYFGIKEKSFLLYITYVFSVALLHLGLDGYLYQYIFQSPGFLADKSILIAAVFSTLAFGRYTQVYIQIEEISKGLNKIFSGLIIGIIALFVFVIFVDSGRPLYYPAANGLALILLLLVISSIIIGYIKGKKIDAFFTIGIFFLTLGFVLFILNNFSVIPNTFITENASKIGTGLEIIFLSLSMANRISLLRSEKEKAQEEALQQSEESNQIKSYFLSNMSHELRTPLNAILGLSESIMRDLPDEKVKENLEVIKYSSLSLLSSIDDILDYSKIEKNELKLESRPFSVHKVIHELKAITYQQARDKGLQFAYEEKAILPERAIGDATRFRQILGNVLNNAVKFTNEGSIKLDVLDYEDKKDKHLLIFSIKDTGAGIKKAKLDRIFESFIQEQIDDKRKFGGFGLGLCIVKALVELHHGKINIKSEVNKGTEVIIKLEFEKAAKETNELILAEKKNLLKGKRILVVEDNPVNQLVIKSILKKWEGTSYDFANHGLEALDKLHAQPCDLILMDLQMPEMDGYEATQAIRAGQAGSHHQNIPIIAVTADTTERSKAKAISVGMDEYLTKPVDRDLLLEKVLGTLYLEKVKLKFD